MENCTFVQVTNRINIVTVAIRKQQFKIKFDKLYSPLCNMAYALISDRDECEDIVQETFIAVWDKGKDELPDQEFTAYMASAVKNNCISYLRRRRLETVPMDEAIINTEPLYNDEEEMEQNIRKRNVLEEALSTLPDKCREVFLMSKLKGMKYREIAKESGISEKTVENHMSKAIKLLREYAAAHPLLFTIITLITILSIHLMNITR
jgi:RNA polymerase sigma-70 factor (ECF subfamily)